MNSYADYFNQSAPSQQLSYSTGPGPSTRPTMQRTGNQMVRLPAGQQMYQPMGDSGYSIPGSPIQGGMGGKQSMYAQPQQSGIPSYPYQSLYGQPNQQPPMMGGYGGGTYAASMGSGYRPSYRNPRMMRVKPPWMSDQQWQQHLNQPQHQQMTTY